MWRTRNNLTSHTPQFGQLHGYPEPRLWRSRSECQVPARLSDAIIVIWTSSPLADGISRLVNLNGKRSFLKFLKFDLQ